MTVGEFFLYLGDLIRNLPIWKVVLFFVVVSICAFLDNGNI